MFRIAIFEDEISKEIVQSTFKCKYYTLTHSHNAYIRRENERVEIVLVLDDAFNSHSLLLCLCLCLFFPCSNSIFHLLLMNVSLFISISRLNLNRFLSFTYSFTFTAILVSVRSIYFRNLIMQISCKKIFEI